MQAVLVGVIEDEKLYYIIDAGDSEEDGALVRQDGSVVDVDFFSFCSRAYGLKKIRSTRFHRYLWDAPKNINSGNWYETFIAKSKEVNKNLLKGVNVLSAIGKNKAKIQKKNDAAIRFIKSLNQNNEAMACCGEMVKSNSANTWFGTEIQRKHAWVARIVMKDLDNSQIDPK